MMTENDPAFRALIVDDEAIARRMVSFAFQNEGFGCECVQDGSEALSRLAAESFDVVVTDLRMPNTHGHALATELLDRSSRPLVVVHTAVKHAALTKELISQGVDDIAFKPTDYSMLAAKTKALLVRRRLEDEQAEERQRNSPHEQERGEIEPVTEEVLHSTLADHEKVLPISSAVRASHQMVTSTQFDAASIAQRIEEDPGIAKDVIQLANRPFYNPKGRPITDVKQAVTMIGQRRIGELALAMSAFSLLEQSKLPWLDLELLWQRSIAAGAASELLLSAADSVADHEGILFASLTHLLGRVVLGSHFSQEYLQMVNDCETSLQPLQKLESQLFPLSHSEVLASLLTDWGLPENCIESVKFVALDYRALNSLPQDQREKAELIKLAAFLAYVAVGEWEEWDLVELPPSHIAERIGVNSLRSIIDEVRSYLPGIASFRKFESPRKKSAKTERPVNYCNMSEAIYDFVSLILQSMGFVPQTVDLNSSTACESMIINRVEATASRKAAIQLEKAACERMYFIRDSKLSAKSARFGDAVVMPCSYAALNQTCVQAATDSDE